MMPFPLRAPEGRLSWILVHEQLCLVDYACHECRGQMKILAAILEAKAIQKILIHLRIPHKPPDLAPARIFTRMSF